MKSLELEMLAEGSLPYRGIRYHKGNLARDAKADKELAEIARRMRLLSDGRFQCVSSCGHLGRLPDEVGTGKVRLFQERMENGKTAYVAVRR